MLSVCEEDLPVSFQPKCKNTSLILSFAIPALSTMSSGSNTTAGRQYPATTVAHALEIARDSPDGADDAAVKNILETALREIWARIQAQPSTYVMTREEFAVFNFFQRRFEGQPLAVEARRRYWDHYSLANGE